MPYGTNSRADFLLTEPGLPNLWVEVKSVTLSRRAGLAEFPDSVTARGAKHMAELAKVVQEGDRAILIFLVQRTDCDRVAVAGDIDPAYAAAFSQALDTGVEVLPLSTDISVQGIAVGAPLAFVP